MPKRAPYYWGQDYPLRALAAAAAVVSVADLVAVVIVAPLVTVVSIVDLVAVVVVAPLVTVVSVVDLVAVVVVTVIEFVVVALRSPVSTAAVAVETEAEGVDVVDDAAVIAAYVVA